METKAIGVAALMIVILAAVTLALVSGNWGQAAPIANNSATTAAPVLFATSQLASYSYLISTQNLSATAQAALSGYTLKDAAQPDGSMNVTITINFSGASQTVNVKPGYKLYVIEASFGDDPSGYDSSFADDGFVMVNPSGYMV